MVGFVARSGDRGRAARDEKKSGKPADEHLFVPDHNHPRFRCSFSIPELDARVTKPSLHDSGGLLILQMYTRIEERPKKPNMWTHLDLCCITPGMVRRQQPGAGSMKSTGLFDANRPPSLRHAVASGFSIVELLVVLGIVFILR